MSWLSNVDWVLVALLAAGLGVLVAVILAATRAGQRRQARDVRQVVEALEDLRSGHARRRPEVDPGSPLALVADAVGRLGHDLAARRGETEAAVERWQTLSDATRQHAIVITDAEGDVQSFSPEATALLGWDESEVLARSAALLFDDASYKELLPKLARRSLRQQGVDSRATMVRRDGTRLQAEITVRWLEGRGGQARGFAMLVRDVTAQARLEHELRGSEQRYRGLVEELAEGVMIVQDGRLLFVNQAAQSLLGGRDTHELSGAPLTDYVATRDLMLVREKLAELERGVARDTWRCALLGPGGAATEVRVRGSQIEHEGRPAVLLLAHDLTPETRVQSELARNEARLDAVLEAVTDGILLLGDGAHGAVVQVANRALAELLGLPAEQILGATEEHLWRLVRERDATLEPLVAAVSGARAAAAGPVRRLLRVSGEREIEVRVVPLVSRQGEPLGRLVACRELTEQRRTERELGLQAERLQHSKLELEQAYHSLTAANAQLAGHGAELERLNGELRRLDDMKTRLLGNVSHELQTPLVSIRGYTEMILKERLGPINDEQRRGLGMSLQNIDRLISMIDNLLALARPDAEGLRLKLSRFGLAPLVQEAVDLLRTQLEGKRLTLTLEIPPSLRLEADRDKMLQVFLNLLSNAIRYNREGGQIRVLARPGQPGYARAQVGDSGLGIPREALGRIFERHYQVRATPGVAPAEGSGIGLSIVRDILRLHGCTIHAESEVGRGSEFIFTLPVAEDDHAGVEEGTARAENRAETKDPASSLSRPRFRVIRRPESTD